MQLHREDRLREIHVKICVHERICSGVRKIVAVNVSAAYDDILRDSPAPVGDIEENKEMLEQRSRGVTVKAVSVRLKYPVGVTDGECKGIRSLLKAHYLPNYHKGLNGFIEVVCAVLGHFTESSLHYLKLLAPLRRSGLFLLGSHTRIAVCENNGAFERDRESLVAVAALIFNAVYHCAHAVLYRKANVGDKMTRDLFKEEYDLFGVRLCLGIDLP